MVKLIEQTDDGAAVLLITKDEMELFTEIYEREARKAKEMIGLGKFEVLQEQVETLRALSCYIESHAALSPRRIQTLRDALSQ